MGILDVQLRKKINGIGYENVLEEVPTYKPTDKEKDMLSLIRTNFGIGYQNMYTPRREFNDLSLLERLSVDQMSFNTYQPNNGNGVEGDIMNAWRSNAISPVVRNKAVSIAAHATARLIFPKVFSQDSDDNEDSDAAMVMEDLMEYRARQSKYSRTFLNMVIGALYSPAAIIHTEYVETYRTVKEKQDDGSYIETKILDEEFSGFQDTVVPCGELYIENFYESNIQRQGFLVWRKVITYSEALSKYGNKYKNFKHVKGGLVMHFSEANNAFYYIYDPNLTGELCEELIYYNRNLDLYQIEVNGVLLTDPDECNPRLDKRYPFVKTGYEKIDSGQFFYYKSLVFKMGPDEHIINELYPMIIDGTYLSVFPPMFARGGEEIGSDVIVPGAVTTLSAPDADLKAINLSSNLAAGMRTMQDVMMSASQSSVDSQQQGDQGPGDKTAFEVARLEQNANTDMKLFMQMIGFAVEDYGKLAITDIIQYMTIGQVQEIEDSDAMQLKFQSFIFPEKQTTSGSKTRKISFDMNLPSEPVSWDDYLAMSIDVLNEQGGMDSKKEIWKVNPELFRENKYELVVSPDVLNPMSEEIERAFLLEEYDRAIANPIADQENVYRDFLLGAYPRSRKDPDKYIKKEQPPMGGVPSPMGAPGTAPGQQGSSPSTKDILSKVAQASGQGMPIPPKSVGGMR